MSFVRPGSPLIEARSFGRATLGQPGMRRAGLLHHAPGSDRPPPKSPDQPKALAERPIVFDLRGTIGHRRWFGALGRLVLYALPAMACLPGFVPFVAAPLPIPGDGERAEFHAQAIAPLRAGGATGRHFVASDLVRRLDSVPERATIALTTVLGEHDDLAHMLQRIGLGTGDADTVQRLIAPIGAPAPGTRFAMVLGARAATGEPRPLQALSFRAAFDLDVTINRQSGTLALIRHPIAVDATPLHLVGTAGASLYRSARSAGAAPETVQAYLQAIDQYLPFESIAPTDQFELVIAHRHAIDGSVRSSGQDGALLYAGVLRDGKPLVQVMRWGSDGNFYTPEAYAGTPSEQGGGQGSGLLAAPVAGNITSLFGMRRHPLLGYVRLHAGVDFGAAYGSPVFAVTDGVVSYAGWHGGHGNYVRLAHGGGIDTGYGHMSRIAVGVGNRVTRGQVIGYVGSTGLSTGPHLHYELFRGGQPVDPLSIRFVPHHSQANPQDIAAFQARLRQLRALPRLGVGTP